jgi:hypothetical protein
MVRAGPGELVLAHQLQREAIAFVVSEQQALTDVCRCPKAGLQYCRLRRNQKPGGSGHARGAGR